MSKLSDRRTRHDVYHRRARQQGFRARAVFKLEEIDQKLDLLRRGDRVLDLGCAPGSWLQYCATRVGPTGKLVGLDRAPLEADLPGARLLVGDVHQITPEELLGPLEAFDVVLSDMAPDTIGVRHVDQARSEALFERALELAEPTEIDFEGPVTVNADCTGEWSFPSPGSISPAVERFLIVDQGREIRAMGWATPIPTVAYTYVARRIPQRCTQGQVQGTYGMQCRGYVMVPGLTPPFPNPALVAATFLYRVTIDRSGEMAGRAVAKVGPGNEVLVLTRSFDVEADCSAAATVTFSGLGTGHANVVLVENAKRGYLLPMFLEPAGGGS